MKQIKFFIIGSAIVLLFGCKKEYASLTPLATIDMGYNIRLNDIKIVSDTAWFVCGGHRDQEGYIFKSKNKGESWSVYTSDFPKSIYCLEITPSGLGLAGGDFLNLWQTTDHGETWSFKWLGDQVPFNAEDRPAVREIKIKNSTDWYFCGGENLGEGILYETTNAGALWNFEFKQYELRTVQINNSQSGFTAGHGACFTFQDSIAPLQQSSFSNDFITSSVCVNNSECWAVSYNGAIYKSENFGKDWSEVEKNNKLFKQRINWNKIIAQQDHLVAVGNNGYFAESINGGLHWELYQLNDRQNLYAAHISNNEVWATSDNGKIYRLI